MNKALEILKTVYKDCKELDDMGLACEYDLYAIDKAIAELKEAMKPKTCEWKYVDNGDREWLGTCGALWSFFDGTPSENGMKFCPECGGKLIEIKLKDKQ